MKTIKEKQIEVLKSNIPVWNRYVQFCKRIDIIWGADLRGADLRGADLRYADLRGADLREADLRGADLREADLREADLRYAALREADLRGADLRGADLDFSCLPLWCGSLKMKTDERQRKQIAYHLLSLIKSAENISDEEKEIFANLKNYANEFHRVYECGILNL
jgi:uncharacterized protein YjbI with pentapeptide repeats